MTTKGECDLSVLVLNLRLSENSFWPLNVLVVRDGNLDDVLDCFAGILPVIMEPFQASPLGFVARLPRGRVW